MPILGTSSTEPYQCGRFRYGCHNSYVPVVWAYPSSVTGKARNPLPSGRLFMVVQTRHRQCAICLTHLASEIEFHSVAGRRHACPPCFKSSSRLPTSTTFPILPLRSMFDGRPPRSECSAARRTWCGWRTMAPAARSDRRLPARTTSDVNADVPRQINPVQQVLGMTSWGPTVR